MLHKGLAVNSRMRFFASKADIYIFRAQEDLYWTHLEKLPSESGIIDNRPWASQNDSICGRCCVKRMGENLRVITLHKTIRGSVLTNRQKEENRALSSDWVIVEWFFAECVVTLMSWRKITSGAEELYDIFFTYASDWKNAIKDYTHCGNEMGNFIDKFRT